MAVGLRPTLLLSRIARTAWRGCRSDQGKALLFRGRRGELWSMSAIVSFTLVTTNPYALSARLISEPQRGHTSFLASAILRNVK